MRSPLGTIVPAYRVDHVIEKNHFTGPRPSPTLPSKRVAGQAMICFQPVVGRLHQETAGRRSGGRVRMERQASVSTAAVCHVAMHDGGEVA
jgi:hypothetical protein